MLIAKSTKATVRKTNAAALKGTVAISIHSAAMWLIIARLRGASSFFTVAV